MTSPEKLATPDSVMALAEKLATKNHLVERDQSSYAMRERQDARDALRAEVSRLATGRGETLKCPDCDGDGVFSMEPGGDKDQWCQQCQGTGRDAGGAASGGQGEPADYPPPDAALAEFTDYFVRNYPGPDTIITDPRWHAPKLFRAAQRAISRAGLRSGVSADPLPRPLLTDLEIQGLRRQARNDPRCADQHWFILMVRAIESYYGVTGAAAQSQPLVEPTADTKPEICYSADGETFHEELSEIFHELDNDGALVVGGTYHQGEALRRTAGYYLQDIECLFERMGEVAYDEAGEHKGDWPDNSLKPGEADELKSLIRRWLDAHVKVWFYTVANVKEVAITEQDLIDYHGPQQHRVKKGGE